MSAGIAIADLEQALAVCAYVVLRHGDAYAPLIDRLEGELEEAKKAETTRHRAERILNSLPVGVQRALAV